MCLRLSPRLLMCRVAVAALLISALGCSRAREEECVDPPKSATTKKKYTHDQLGKVPQTPDPNADWCRTCVKSPKGWASCQLVYATEAGEDRAEVKKRSRQRACDDAGYAKGACPDKAVIAVSCKGDAPPVSPAEAQKALQRLFFRNKGKQQSEGKGPTKAPPAKPQAAENK